MKENPFGANNMKKSGCVIISPQKVSRNSRTAVNPPHIYKHSPHCSCFVSVEYRTKTFPLFPQQFPCPLILGNSHQKWIFLKTFKVCFFVMLFPSLTYFLLMLAGKWLIWWGCFHRISVFRSAKNGDDVKESTEASISVYYCCNCYCKIQEEQKHELCFW